MTKSLLEIAKENGAFIVKDEIGEDLVIPVSELQATINAYNAQNSEPVAYRQHIEHTKNGITSHEFGYSDIQIMQGDDALYLAPQTLPPEWAEYVGRLEKALQNYINNCEKNKRLTCNFYSEFKQALADKSKG